MAKCLFFLLNVTTCWKLITKILAGLYIHIYAYKYRNPMNSHLTLKFAGQVSLCVRGLLTAAGPHWWNYKPYSWIICESNVSHCTPMWFCTARHTKQLQIWLNWVALQTEEVHLAPSGVLVQDRWVQGPLRPQPNREQGSLCQDHVRENKWVCKILKSVRRKWEAEGEKCQLLCKRGGLQTAAREEVSGRML